MASEKRLIDANALKNKAKYQGHCVRPLVTAYHLCVSVSDIDNAPTVDAVEVVRCKDYRFWRDTWVAPDGITEHGYCHLEESDDVVVGRWDDDFCSYGERKGE